MSIHLETVDGAAVDLAREGLYRFLAAALRNPAAPGWQLLLDSACQQMAGAAAELLRAEAVGVPIRLGFGEMRPELLTLQPLLAYLSDGEEAIRAEYHRVFGLLPPRECQPYETEYHTTEEPFFRAQQMADVAGFYRAFGVQPSLSAPERPDYLPLELEFMAFLTMKKRLAPAVEDREVCAGAEATFVRDHLAWWVPSFTLGLRHRAGGGFYAAVAEVLAAWLPIERGRFGVSPPSVPLQMARAEPAEDQAECAGCAS